ncbi:hypothetical protein ACP4OV_027870 [Aristida adscensionis]
MKRPILALSLLFLASQGSWCAAESSRRIFHLTRPHLQVQQLHEIEGKKHLEIQSPRRHEHDEVSTVEMKHSRRMGTGHRGGSAGGGAAGAGAGSGGRAVGGGGAVTRPHGSKNGAAALPAPAPAAALALALAAAVALSTFSF